MKTNALPKIAGLLLLALFTALPDNSAKAAPGDTTWVTIWNLKQLDHYGSYDTSATLPASKRYRKIRLHYILGVYNCPNSPQYCSDWDYTTQVIVKPKNMDTMEIARIITPYAGDWLGKNISHDYVVDVTDYASALHDNLDLRFRYEGYSWGFNLTLKLEFIEGIPPMDVVAIGNIYDGYFAYGSSTDPIENHLTAKTFSYSSTASVGRVYVKNSVSGHGSDNTGCSEFCSKYYNLKVDNIQMTQKQLWRNDCGSNPVSPQPGTWIYERANWCPGAIVNPIFHDISTWVAPDTPFDVDIDMQVYVGNGGAGYNFVSQLIKYGLENHTTDVSIEEIIAPRKDQHYFSNNSACMNPVIRIKNTGYDSVHAIVFKYGLRGLVPDTYTWTGSIGFLEEATITFPSSTPLMSQPNSSNFDVKVTSVNGMADDDYKDNNIYSSKTNTLLTLPAEFVIRTKTNAGNKPALNTNETRWTLVRDNGDTIVSRPSMTVNSMYRDSVYNLADGCYKFTIDDSGCDGFSWWAKPGEGNGTLTFNLPGSESILHNFNGDFGCRSTTYFYIGNRPSPPPPIPVDETGIAERSGENTVVIFPNPANGNLKVRVEGISVGTLEIVDITGRVIVTKEYGSRNGSAEQLSTAALQNGIYFLTVKSGARNIGTKKFIIQH